MFQPLTAAAVAPHPQKRKTPEVVSPGTSTKKLGPTVAPEEVQNAANIPLDDTFPEEFPDNTFPDDTLHEEFPHNPNETNQNSDLDIDSGGTEESVQTQDNTIVPYNHDLSTKYIMEVFPRPPKIRVSIRKNKGVPAPKYGNFLYNETYPIRHKSKKKRNSPF